MPGLITHLTAIDDPPPVKVSKPKKAVVALLTLMAFLGAAPAASAVDWPNPGWEVD